MPKGATKTLLLLFFLSTRFGRCDLHLNRKPVRQHLGQLGVRVRSHPYRDHRNSRCSRSVPPFQGSWGPYSVWLCGFRCRTAFVYGDLASIISASLSDGVRALTPDVVYLAGCYYGYAWIVAAGYYLFRGSSDDRAVSTSNIGNGGGIAPGDDSFLWRQTTTLRGSRSERMTTIRASDRKGCGRGCGAQGQHRRAGSDIWFTAAVRILAKERQ
jgi:hypothetical protein